jgi:phospholipid transport system substrate-binding protein
MPEEQSNLRESESIGAARRRRCGRSQPGSWTRWLVAGMLTAMLPWNFLLGSDLDDAIAVVDRLHDALIAAAAETSADTSQRYEMLYPVITATHDLPAIAQLTVRRYWRDWTDAERAAFVAAFEELSVMTYASRFASVGADSFEIVGSHVDGNRIEVNALIKRDSADDVTMDYLLRSSGSSPDGQGQDWRIVNILAEGVSDLALKIDEYGSVLETGSATDLVAYIEEQAAALR